MRKIDRSAFLYMEPRIHERSHTFAQCSSCIFLARGSYTCNILEMEVLPGDTCALYIEGKEIPMLAYAYVTPKEAGYEARKVRCENCYYLNGITCELFAMLNRQQPLMFNLDPVVSPYGCCNANTPKERK